MDITMDPDKTAGPRTYTLTSPKYPKKYPHNQDCEWNFNTVSGKIKMTFTKFNVEWNKSCSKKDYLYVAKISKYTKTWLCGSSIPKKFKLVSKKKDMLVKFHSNKSVTKAGFSVKLTAY
jgi:hypothetical protein